MRQSFNRRKENKDYLTEFLNDKPTIEPPCQHFGKCGGCDLQNYPYKLQVAGKLASFHALLEEKRLTKHFSAVEVKAIASPREIAYRQKMDFVCAFGHSGLRGESFSEVVDLQECHLIEEISFQAYKKALDLAVKNGLPFYDFIKNSGFLRYITVRRTRLGQQLVSFLTISREYSDIMEKIALKLIEDKIADSVCWQVQEDKTDTSFGDLVKFWGQEFLQEEILGNRFNLSTNTFFQANLEIAQEAYRLIQEHVKSFHPNDVLDLFSGTCTIGISLSSVAKRIVAIENFLPNRDMALRNFETNKVRNIEYIDQDVAAYMATTSLKPDYVVCNPPRTGVDEKSLRKIVEMKPQGIAYLSCNPKTLLEDLNILTYWYSVEQALVFDMFPQTKHFETLVLLRKK